jgi:hypothetical protein
MEPIDNIYNELILKIEELQKENRELREHLKKYTNGNNNKRYDSNMNKIQEYISINECSKQINIRAKIISDNCREKAQSTKCGYIFRYAS